MQLKVWQFGTAGHIYCSLQCGSFFQRNVLTAAYSVAVCYSGTDLLPSANIVADWYSGTNLLQLKEWQFVIAGRIYFLQLSVWHFVTAERIDCSLQSGSLL